jgi:hypothetical protein
LENTILEEFEAFPLIVCWDLWRMRNKMIFEEGLISPYTSSIKSSMLLMGIGKILLSRSLGKIVSWSTCGVGKVLHISNLHSFSSGLWFGNNNMVEVNIFLMFVEIVMERGIQDVQIFGDSQRVVGWVLG